MSLLWAVPLRAPPAGLELFRCTAWFLQPIFSFLVWLVFLVLLCCVLHHVASSWEFYYYIKSMFLMSCKVFFNSLFLLFYCATFLFLTFFTLVLVNLHYFHSCSCFHQPRHIRQLYCVFYSCQPLYICASTWVRQEKEGKMITMTLFILKSQQFSCALILSIHWSASVEAQLHWLPLHTTQSLKHYWHV